MIDRVPCKTEHCGSTILPSTAAKTGGFCMPCVNRARAEEHARYVAAHRIDVDRFAGLTDVVDILLRMHDAPEPDPLKHYVPFAKTKTALYRSLTQSDADRLVVASSTDAELARAVAHHLACFAEVDMAFCQRALLERADPFPAHVFRAAAPPIVAQLFALLDRAVALEDADLRGATLSALAWTRAPSVIEAMLAWSQGRRWNGMLFRAWANDAKAAGYQLEAGVVRDLTLPDCFRLTPADAGTVSLFERDPQGPPCPHCARAPISLLRIDSLEGVGLPSVVPMCIGCAGFATTYAQLGVDGSFRWLSADAATVAPETGWDPPPPPRRATLVRRRAWEVVDWCEAEGLSQIGGHPSWIGDPEYPPCRVCARTMLTVAQVAMEDFDQGDGIFYVHHCAACRVVAVGYQQT